MSRINEWASCKNIAWLHQDLQFTSSIRVRKVLITPHCLVVWLPFLVFPEILEMSSSQLTNSNLFQRGFSPTTNHQFRCNLRIHIIYHLSDITSGLNHNDIRIHTCLQYISSYDVLIWLQSTNEPQDLYRIPMTKDGHIKMFSRLGLTFLMARWRQRRNNNPDVMCLSYRYVRPPVFW